MPMLGSNAELDAPSEILLLRKSVLSSMHTYIQKMQASVIGMVITTHIREWTFGLNYYGYSVELVVARMEDVSRHSQRLYRGTTKFIESCRKIRSNDLRGAAFDLVPVNKVNHLPISHERHRGTAGLVLAEVLAGARRGLEILPGEYRNDLLRHDRMLERECESRAGIPCRAATNRIDKYQHRPPLVSEGCIDICCAGELPRTHSSHLGAHRSH
jgi:hypothetical protein